jgi:hypothetical protein
MRHPDVVATQSAGAIRSEVETEFVRRERGVEIGAGRIDNRTEIHRR